MTPRHCLACGARLRAARVQGRHRLRCPRCGFIHYDNPVPAVIAIVARRGRLLLARRAAPPYAGWWDLPGGFMEAGELPPETLDRELREELDVGMARARLVGFATDRYGPSGFRVLTTVYEVTPTSLRIRPADDVAEARWFPLSAIPWARVAFPAMRRLLRRWVESRVARRSARGPSYR